MRTLFACFLLATFTVGAGADPLPTDDAGLEERMRAHSMVWLPEPRVLVFDDFGRSIIVVTPKKTTVVKRKKGFAKTVAKLVGAHTRVVADGVPGANASTGAPILTFEPEWRQGELIARTESGQVVLGVWKKLRKHVSHGIAIFADDPTILVMRLYGKGPDALVVSLPPELQKRRTIVPPLADGTKTVDAKRTAAAKQSLAKGTGCVDQTPAQNGDTAVSITIDGTEWFVVTCTGKISAVGVVTLDPKPALRTFSKVSRFRVSDDGMGENSVGGGVRMARAWKTSIGTVACAELGLHHRDPENGALFRPAGAVCWLTKTPEQLVLSSGQAIGDTMLDDPPTLVSSKLGQPAPRYVWDGKNFIAK